jgi:hypothetical protein
MRDTIMKISSGSAQKLFPLTDAIETARKVCMDRSALAAVLVDRLLDHLEMLKYRSSMEAFAALSV